MGGSLLDDVDTGITKVTGIAPYKKVQSERGDNGLFKWAIPQSFNIKFSYCLALQLLGPRT